MYPLERMRPNLSFSIGTLAKFVEKPIVIHWLAVKRVIKYVNCTKDIGSVSNDGKNSWNLVVYVDADWTGDPKTQSQ